MLETLVITFREGLEAFLIIAIMLAYVTKTGRLNLVKPIYTGIAIALLISATTGYHVKELAENPAMEGGLSLIAGLLVASLTVYVMKTAHRVKQGITDRIDRHAEKEGVLAEIGICFFTILMIAREGMETALMLGAISGQTDGTMMLTGALAGLALVGLIAYLWVHQSERINLKLFMQVTGIFLVLFSIDLFLYGLHELSEIGQMPIIPQGMELFLHEATEPFGHGSIYSQVITYSLLAVPMGWLMISYVRDKFLRHGHQAAE